MKGIGKSRGEALRKKGIAHVCDLAHPATFLAQQSGYTPNQFRDWQDSAMTDPDITHSRKNLADSGKGGS